MARGGSRPNTGGKRLGAGRKPRSTDPAGIPKDIMREIAAQATMSPLDYMMAVMNDPCADILRRDRMAVAAAPYVHPKAEVLGKREQAEKDALTAERGSDWESLLNRSDITNGIVAHGKSGLASQN